MYDGCMKTKQKRKEEKTTLDNYEVGFIETNGKPKRKKKIIIQDNKPSRVVKFLVAKRAEINTKIGDVVKKVSHRSKKTKKMTKLERQNAKNMVMNGIMGVGQLLVVVSIAYSASVIFIGIDTLVSKIALLPQVIFALVISIKAFIALYK